MSSALPFYSKYKQLLPVCVWCIFSLLAIWGAVIGEKEGNFVTRLVLSVQHYVAFFLLLALIGVFFFLRKYYKYVVFVALFAGVFNLANFSGASFAITLGSDFTIQPLSLVVAFFFLVINFERISELFEKYDPAQTRRLSFSEEEKLKFREKYQSFTNEQLNTVRSDFRYVAEARRAAEELLSERVSPKD